MEFTLKTKINATAKEIYKTWLSSEGHASMTGGEASISDKPGEHFTAWNEYIEGRNIEMEPYKRIVQTWRTSEFKAEEEDSCIEILLKEIDGHTEVTLIHTNLSEDGEQYKNGWENHYFQPMREYFSK